MYPKCQNHITYTGMCISNVYGICKADIIRFRDQHRHFCQNIVSEGRRKKKHFLLTYLVFSIVVFTQG